MRMANKTISLIPIVLGLLHTPFAQAGNEGAHGGGAFACLSENGDMSSVESQDLWEAEKVWGLALSNWQGDERDLSFRAVERIKPINSYLYDKTVDALKEVFQRREILEVKIEEIGDSNRKFSKDICASGKPAFVQAAIYWNLVLSEQSHLPMTYRLIYASRVFNTMSELHKAALNVHEALYKVLREMRGDRTSEDTRKAVSYLFSKASDSVLTTVLPAFRFNPNSELPFRDKVRLLKERFDRSGQVTLSSAYDPKSRREVRDCYLFSDHFEDVIDNPDAPAKVQYGIKLKKNGNWESLLAPNSYELGAKVGRYGAIEREGNGPGILAYFTTSLGPQKSSKIVVRQDEAGDWVLSFEYIPAGRKDLWKVGALAICIKP